MNNAELVQHVYDSFAVGDVQAVLDAFGSEIEWHECPSFPFIANDEPLIGPDAVMQNVFTQIPVYFDNFHIVVETVFSNGDEVAMAGYYQGTWKSTGKEFKANATHVWRAQDGKLTRFFQAVDTAEIMAP